jgi:hypothetical protein
MTFEYLKVEQHLDCIDIEDLGNFCLNVLNDSGEEWYMRAKCDLGWVTIDQYGPLLADIDNLQYYFTYSYMKFEYSEKKLYKIVKDFLNNDKRNITQAFLIEEEDFENRLGGLVRESN